MNETDHAVRIIGIGAAIAATVAGCATTADVLETSGAHIGNGSSGTPWAICAADVLDERGASTGDRCTFTSSDCGVVPAPDRCAWHEYVCDGAGHLDKMVTEKTDCTAGYPDADPSANIGDCAAALETGSSGDSCTEAFRCAKADADPCCVEAATCDAAGADGKDVLLRYRLCAEGCESVTPTPGAPVISECPADASIALAGSPCAGDFVCPLNVHAPVAFVWCGDGIVRYAHTEHSMLSL